MTEYYDFSNGRGLRHNLLFIADEVCGIVLPFFSLVGLFGILKMDNKVLNENLGSFAIIYGFSLYGSAFSFVYFPIKTSVMAFGMKLVLDKNSNK